MSGRAGDREQPPDCILEDLERPGVLPPSPSPLTRSSQLVSQCITRTASCDGSHEHHTRLPGTFDSLQLVHNTGSTPSPRPDTPLVLLPLQTESARESLQESLKRRLKSSLGVRLGGRTQCSDLITCPSCQTTLLMIISDQAPTMARDKL